MSDNIKITENTVRSIHNAIRGHGIVAGGACRAIHNLEEINDIDIYCNTPQDYAPLKAIVSTFPGKEKENAMVFQRGKFQLIKPIWWKRLRTYGTPVEILGNFTYTVCCGYYTDDGVKFIGDTCLDDLANKRLAVQYIVCPIFAIRHAMKYATYGYTLAPPEIVKIFAGVGIVGGDARDINEMLQDYWDAGAELRDGDWRVKLSTEVRSYK